MKAEISVHVVTARFTETRVGVAGSLLLFLAVICLCSCQKNGSDRNALPPGSSGQPTGKAPLKLTSTAFANGEMIPAKYTCSGANISPPLAWQEVPVASKSLALIVDDPDAPGKTWVHWVVYNLPASMTELAENQLQLSPGAKFGTNDFSKTGYGGPCPPSGTHRYMFKLYALDFETSLQEGATKEELLGAMQGHILAEGELMGTYKR